MTEKNVFAENLDSLINKFDVNVKPLVRSEDSVTYGYVMRVRRGENCPTINKAESIVQIIKRHPSLAHIELWMFFASGYFAQQPKQTISSKVIEQITDLLSDADKLGILQSTPEQRVSVEMLASVIYKRMPSTN